MENPERGSEFDLGIAAMNLVRLIVLLAFISAGQGLAFAGGDELPGLPDSMEPVSVRVTERIQPENAPFCADFNPEEQRILGWLVNTWPVPVRWLTSDVYSPCVTEAVVIMADGSKANLTLRSSGVGQLVDAKGKRHVRFGPVHWTDPFGGPFFNLD